MDRMLTVIAAKLGGSGSRNDDDLVDRLHNRYTVVFLVIFAVIISTNQYVGTPISCFAPNYYNENQERYVDRACWVSSTYYLKDPKTFTHHQTNIDKRYVNYYQWVPLVLCAQAILFRFPYMFWRVFSGRSGINIKNLVEAAETIQNALYPERREKTIRYMIRHLDHYLDYQRDYRGGCGDACQQCLAMSRYRCFQCCVCGNRRGSYLIILYAFTKLLYLICDVGQFYLLDYFLGGGYLLFGFQALREELAGRQWDGAAAVFPRFTFCDFSIVRPFGNEHPNTVHCVLPINFFTEKLFLIMWFWLALLGALTALGLVRWMWVLLPERGRRRYVRQNLKIMARLRSDGTAGSERDRKLSRRFTECYLRQDGVFVLKLVAKNSTDLVVADIIAALWDNYRVKPSTSNAHHTGSINTRRPSSGIAYIGDAADLALEPVDIL